MKIDEKEYHKHTFENRREIEQSSMCGCASCQSIFPASEIESYIKDKNGDTALCPYCSTDAVIGDACGLTIDERILRKLGKNWW